MEAEKAEEETQEETKELVEEGVPFIALPKPDLDS